MTPRRPPWRDSSRAGAALTRTVVVAGAMGVNVAAVAPAWSTHEPYVVVHVVMSGALAVAGIAMGADPALRGVGRLMVVAGYLQVLPALSWRDVGPTSWLSWVLGPAAIVPIGAVLLAYPSGRLNRPVERFWLLAATTWLVVGRLILGLFPPRSPVHGWWPVVVRNHLAWSVIDAVYNVGGLVLIISFGVLLLRRWRRSAGLDHFVEAPVGIAAAAVGVTAATHLAAFLAAGESKGSWAAVVQDLALLAVPCSLIAVAIARQYLYASVAAALAGLPPAATPADVQQALATSLHDPALEILYWVEDAHGYVDTRGSAAPEHRSQERLEVIAEAGDGSPLAVIRVDAAAHRHPELLASALRLGTLALENARLQAALLAQLTAVQESRARIVEAALAERRRIERDLHDGAQQGLLATAATLGRLHHRAQDPALRAIVDEARDQLRDSLEHLRDLAHGIHPALLTEGGLRPAIASVAEGLPVAIHVAVPDRRWPPNVEATAYFVICEALANAAKHSGSNSVDVRIDGDDHVLRLMLSDDGIGGARQGNGGGLRGLHDRVTALGGELTLSSARGSGTRINVMLPCG